MLAFKIDAENPQGKVQEVPIPSPLPGEALIKVLRAGVCNTDLEIQRGYMGFSGILGHEFVGIVESVNSVDGQEQIWVGKRVCGDINLACNDCCVCSLKTDRSRNHCPTRTVLGILNKDGTMSEYLTLPVCNLHEVPATVTDEEAIFTEPLAAACRIIEQDLINSVTDRVAILGDGKLGLMIAEVVGREYLKACSENPKVSPPQPVLIGKHTQKMDLVQESGIKQLSLSECKASDHSLKKELSQSFDVVIDATGSPAGLSLSSSLCRPMGTIVLKSTCASGEMFNAAPFVIDELKVVGSRCGPFPKALELLSLDENNDENMKPLRVGKYVTKCFQLSDAEEALKFAAEKSTMKVQIVCSR